MRNLARTFWSDQRGNIAVLSTVGLTIGIGMAALGVDVGKIFTDRRKAQSVADLAAIAAAGDLPNAEKAARATVMRNGFAADSPLTVELGVYTADAATPAPQRFKAASASSANAARVTLNTSSPLFFARAFVGTDKLAIRTVATATSSAFASFAIGSRLLKIEGGLLNQLLGGLLGANLSLSVMDYQALADARLDLFDFMKSAATRANLTVDNYDQLLKSNIKAADLVNAMADTERAKAGNSTAARALTSIAQGLNDPNAKAALGAIADVGPYRSMSLGQKPQASVAVSMLDMLGAFAQVANGQRQIEAGLDLAVPGIASASLKLAVGERPVGTSWVTVGSLGASVHTAQTRLLLTIKVGGTGIVPSVTIPLYLEIAPATATLTNVTCGFPDMKTSRVTLGVKPGIVDSWIGAVSNTEFNNFKTAPNPGPATLVSIPIPSIKVSGRAHVTVSNMSPTPTTFTWTEIQQQTKKTVGTTNFTASLLSRLIGDLNLDVSVLGLDLGIGGATEQAVAAILASAVTPIDKLLASLLSTLGIGLGQADVWVLGLRCDGAVLVN